MRENRDGAGEARKTSDCSLGLTRVEEREGRKEGWVESLRLYHGSKKDWQDWESSSQIA